MDGSSLPRKAISEAERARVRAMSDREAAAWLRSILDGPGPEQTPYDLACEKADWERDDEALRGF